MSLLLALVACTEPGADDSAGATIPLRTCEELADLGGPSPDARDVEPQQAQFGAAELETLCDDPSFANLLGTVSLLNTDWRDLGALSCVQSISGSLVLSESVFLESLDGAENLREIGGLKVHGAPWLSSMEALAPALRASTPDIELSALHSLPDLSALRCLQEAKRFTLGALDGVPDLTPLVQLTTASHGFSVFAMPIVDLSGLESLETTESFQIARNPALTRLDGIAALRDVESYAIVTENAALTDISALGGLDRIGGDLEITDNISLNDADAVTIAGQIDVGGEVEVSGNGP